jgi:hypothetical protein
MIYIEVNFSRFNDEFYNAGRGDQFSYEAKKALFEYTEELAAFENYELDIISLCCVFNEIEQDEIERETGCKDLVELHDNTMVIELSNGAILYQSF